MKLLVLIISLCFYCSCYSQHFKVKTSLGFPKTLNMEKLESKLLVLLNYRHCDHCVKSINKFISEDKRISSNSILIVELREQGIKKFFEKKRIKMQNEYGKFYFINSRENNKENIFSFYKCSSSPEIILISKNGEHTHFSNFELFNNSNQLSASAKNVIQRTIVVDTN
ncbi:MAG: hypothetical protein CL840_13295 [Crocinitomicaceae bacterium]|nr:hypothetical protein [Crocinitomicaceae bacterium]|tara:strand:+ start:1423 stop:1926 length:504 start_codon:yes stop_codon:yes gene_type:complete